MSTAAGPRDLQPSPRTRGLRLLPLNTHQPRFPADSSSTPRAPSLGVARSAAPHTRGSPNSSPGPAPAPPSPQALPPLLPPTFPGPHPLPTHLPSAPLRGPPVHPLPLRGAITPSGRLHSPGDASAPRSHLTSPLLSAPHRLRSASPDPEAPAFPFRAVGLPSNSGHFRLATTDGRAFAAAPFPSGSAR